MAYAGYGCRNRLGETKPETAQVLQLCYVLRPEQTSSGIVLQRDGLVGMHRHEWHRDMLDECSHAPQIRLLLGAALPHTFQDIRERLAQRTITRTLSFEIEALRVIGVARGIEESELLRDWYDLRSATTRRR